MKSADVTGSRHDSVGKESQAPDTRMSLDRASRTLTVRMLALVNQESVGISDISEMLGMVKEFTGLEALAIRLRVGDEFPYFATKGFFTRFKDVEGFHWEDGEEDKIISRSPGCALGDCICGDVIHERCDPSLPFFTDGGSFWTNNMSELVTAADDEYAHPVSASGFCTQGYESVAIIPLRSFGDLMGIFLLEDEREDCFTLEMVLFLEAIAAIISIALARMTAEQTLQRSNEELETRVQARTAELVDSNRLLEREIRHRSAIQDRLILSQQRLELAMRAGNLGFWDWNVTTGEVFYDQRWTDMLGYALNDTEPHYRSWQSALHPDDKPRVLERLKECVKAPGDAYEIEYRLGTKSGEWRWILDRAQVVERDDSGRALRMTGAYIDVTDRKRVQEELHQSEERLRTIFENANDCIYIKDSSLQYTHVNPYFMKMLDLPESGIIGCTDEDLFGKDAAQILKEVDARVLRGESIEQEHTRRVKDVPTTFLDVKVPMRNSKGEIVGIFGISRNMTDRKNTPSVPQTIGRRYPSRVMNSTLHAARLAAQTDITILLTGESGAGKDHVARYIHDHSKRAHGPFFALNCAAISPELFESELFGYEPGAFTGARFPKRGLLELAEGGTILLNEIGELSLPLQSKLLTFLDSRQFTRVGGVKAITVSARLIAATNRNLEQEVKRSRFRNDLFFRLNVFSIEVPPLRERIADLPLLVSDILKPTAGAMGLDAVPSIDPEAMAELAAYNWPGNVRELRNVLERALILCDKRRIRIRDLALHHKLQSMASDEEWRAVVSFPKNESLKEVTMDLKRALVTEALKRTGGRRKRAAELLGITADALKHYMQTFDLY